MSYTCSWIYDRFGLMRHRLSAAKAEIMLLLKFVKRNEQYFETCAKND